MGEEASPTATSPRLGRTASPRDRPLRAGLTLALLALLCFFPATRGGFIWDDDVYVRDNATVQRADGLRRIWTEPGASPQFYPLVFTTFWVERRLWGPDPRPMHVLNILLHASAAILVWRVLLALGAPWPWLVAAVFAVHPVTVESVAWIAERKNTLSTTFYFASMLAYVRFAGLDGSPRRSRWLYGLSFLLFACALLSKTVTSSLPAALVLIAWWKRDRVVAGDVVPLIPFFVVGAGMGLTTAWLETTHVGASGPAWRLSLVEHVLLAGRIPWFYAGKLLLPVNLTFIYPRWTIDAHAAPQYLYPAAAAAVLAALFVARRPLGKGPFVAAALFVGTLFPALGFFSVYPMRYSYVADHFQYLAAPAMLALLVGALMSAARAVAGGGAIGTRIAPAAALALLGALTWSRCGVYRDQETLWLDTLRRNPACWLAWNNLGRIRQFQNRVDEALAAYEKALHLNPAEPLHHYNTGNVLMIKGRVADARRHLEQAVALDPAYAAAHHGLANALKAQGAFAQAVDEYRAALRINDAITPAHYNLANTLASLGQTGEAIAHYRRTIELDPSHANAHFQLAVSLVERGDLADRIAHLEEALRLRPGWLLALNELALTLATACARAGDSATAAGYAERAFALAPAMPSGALGEALIKRLEEDCGEAVLRRAPGEPPAIRR